MLWKPHFEQNLRKRALDESLIEISPNIYDMALNWSSNVVVRYSVSFFRIFKIDFQVLATANQVQPIT